MIVFQRSPVDYIQLYNNIWTLCKQSTLKEDCMVMRLVMLLMLVTQFNFDSLDTQQMCPFNVPLPYNEWNFSVRLVH